jgi:hypothetical protein
VLATDSNLAVVVPRYPTIAMSTAPIATRALVIMTVVPPIAAMAISLAVVPPIAAMTISRLSIIAMSVVLTALLVMTTRMMLIARVAPIHAALLLPGSRIAMVLGTGRV